MIITFLETLLDNFCVTYNLGYTNERKSLRLNQIYLAEFPLKRSYVDFYRGYWACQHVL